MPYRVNTQRVRKGLKRKGMGFALVQKNVESAASGTAPMNDHGEWYHILAMLSSKIYVSIRTFRRRDAL